MPSAEQEELATLRKEKARLARELAECRAEIRRRDAIQLGRERGLYETFSLRWRLQAGEPLIKLNGDLAVVTEAIRVYTGWLGIKIVDGWGSVCRPTCAVATEVEHQQLMREVFNHFSLLFEHGTFTVTSWRHTWSSACPP